MAGYDLWILGLFNIIISRWWIFHTLFTTNFFLSNIVTNQVVLLTGEALIHIISFIHSFINTDSHIFVYKIDVTSRIESGNITKADTQRQCLPSLFLPRAHQHQTQVRNGLHIKEIYLVTWQNVFPDRLSRSHPHSLSLFCLSCDSCHKEENSKQLHTSPHNHYIHYSLLQQENKSIMSSMITESGKITIITES